MIEYNIVGLEAGEDKEYMEVILLSNISMDKKDQLFEMLKKRGCHNMRIQKINLSEKPDFKKTII